MFGKTTRKSLAVIGLLMACAMGEAAAPQGAAILDVDFQQGPGGLPDGAKVSGGMWLGGWLVTDNDQKIILDCGYEIKNGAMELTFARYDTSGSPTGYTAPPLMKPNWLVSLWQNDKFSRNEGNHFLYDLSIAQRYEGFQGTVRARLSPPQGEGAFTWDLNFGKWTDLTLDGQTPMTIRLVWKDGKAVFTDIKGNEYKPEQGVLNNLRYVMLGGGSRGSTIGVRFLKLRVMDLDKSEAPAKPKRRVVFDVDLTKGPSALPAQSYVLGGKWGDGWQATGKNQRIVFDPGYQIRNGILEVTVARENVEDIGGEKIDIMGIYEEPSMDHSDMHGDTFLLRIGEAEVTKKVQACIKLFSKERIPEHWGQLWEQRYGKVTDWVMDGKTPHTFKFEWKNGTASFTDLTGKVYHCPNNAFGQINNLRYVALGGDRYNDGSSILGMRFLRMRLIDLDVPEAAK
ncbi:MAG: hypothetical protein N3D11_17330 [Candidatus Sumerlaeia bacterium]|nr:hypothetical protein [Candidatus Sumerlaeia bacterium]